MKLFQYTFDNARKFLNLDQVVAYETDKYGSVKVYLPSGAYLWLMGDDAKRLLKEIEQPKGGKK